MKSPLLLALSLAPLACAGAEPARGAPQPPVTLVAPPVVVNVDAPPAAPAAPGPATVAAHGNEREIAEFGMVGLLNSGDAAEEPAGGGGKKYGVSNGDSLGAGGLGLSGVGEGGGGAGTGIGFGSAGGARPPSIRMGAMTSSGRLPPEVIMRIVRQNFGRFRLCYDAGLRANPALEGRISVSFTIKPDGSISGVRAAASTMPDPGVVACITRAFSSLSFPAPEGGLVVVMYPLMFSPGTAAPAPAGP